MFHLVSVWYVTVEVGKRVIIMNKHAILEPFMLVIAVVDSMTGVVNRYGMKEIVITKRDPGLVYRKFVFKRVISKLIRVVVRISVQLL